ncbi:MAG: hypothetical protein ACOYCB_11705 [Fastidiosipilaceae bacterium]
MTPKTLCSLAMAPLLKQVPAPTVRKVCQCKERGIYRCSCPRLYTNPTANWGWDSYHERWFYGHSLYALTAADSVNDLPILRDIS